MVNQIVLVGRIARTPETRTTESGKKVATLTLAVPRNYKNVNGEYDTDFFDCTLWSSVAESTSEYYQTGDMIGNNVIWYTERQKIINPFIYK